MRKFSTFFTLTLLAALILGIPAYASTDINVTIDGIRVEFADQQPVIVDGRTLVPVAGVFEMVGFVVEWDGNTQQITLSRDNETVVLTIGSAIFTVNGVSHMLDVPAQIIGGRTMLPLATLLRSIGYYVDWDGATSTVLVSSPRDALVSISPNIITAQMNVPLEEGTIIRILFANVSNVPLAEDFTIDGLPMGLDYDVFEVSLDGANVAINGIPTIADFSNVRIEVADMVGNLFFSVDVMVAIGGEEFSTTVTSLALDDRGLLDADIVNLRYLTNLTDISLNSNFIRDLTVFGDLPNLANLSLSNNAIRDWSPVVHVPNLIRGQQRQSSITLPNRRLTDAERQEWIDDYWLFGGPTDFEFEVVALINEIRQEYGLNMLTINDSLMLATRFYVQTKVNLGLSLSHTAGPYGGSGGTASAFGSSWNTANGAVGQGTPVAVVNGWMNSPGHRRNILNSSSRSIGIGRYGSFTYMLTTR